MNRLLRLTAGLVIAIPLVAACSAQSDVAPMPAEVNDTDLHFLGMMVPHHKQAVDMSDIVLSAQETSAATRDLAQRIKSGQQEEIDQMNNWAINWDQGAVMEQHAPHIANGMLTPDQMAQLEQTVDDGREVLFLQLMYTHHEQVIAMTQDQIINGGYQPLRDLAQVMVDVQTDEMAEMENILAGQDAELA